MEQTTVYDLMLRRLSGDLRGAHEVIRKVVDAGDSEILISELVEQFGAALIREQKTPEAAIRWVQMQAADVETIGLGESDGREG